MKNKKTLYIIIAISLVLLTVLLLSVFEFGCSTKAKIESINLDRAFFSHYSSSDNSLEYLSDSGITWYKYDIANQTKAKIYDGEILSPENINYRPDGQSAVVYSSYPDYNVKNYNFTNNVLYDLSEFTNEVIWSSDQKRIYYTYNKIPGPDDTGSQYVFNINESDYAGKNWRTIKDLSKTDYVNAALYPSFDETYIYYMPTPIDDKGGTLKRLYVNTKQDENITDDDIIYSRIVFSPDRSQFAFLDSEDNLVIQNVDSKESKKTIYNAPIDINTIVWANDNSYIYIIQNLNELIKINTNNSKSSNIILDDNDVSYTNILDDTITPLGIDKNTNYLYFTYNNYLYKIPLK